MGAYDTGATVADAVRQGFYARCLRRFLAHFSSRQLLVLQYELCAADPATQLARTYRFLGLADHHPDALRRPINVSGQKLELDPDARRRLVDLYAPDVDELVSLFPDVDRSLWPNFSGLRG
jgi:hypothetical protein